MKEFLDEDFLLRTETARQLYHNHAARQPIIDYHCHLPPGQIASDHRFENLTKIWLDGDHYKWRAMRANGIAEHYVTGKASDEEKFEKWAETVPYTMRNPLYHWTHMELKNPFGLKVLLNKNNAKQVYDTCSAMLGREGFSTHGLLLRNRVETVCTTDDPADDLKSHIEIKDSGFSVQVLPTFRPDKAMAVEDIAAFLNYLSLLKRACESDLDSFDSFLEGLQARHDFFGEQGCRLSDHGLETVYAEPFSHRGCQDIYERLLAGKPLNGEEVLEFKSAMLYHFSLMDHAKGWTQQFHLGALRNNNQRMLRSLGPDTGWDSIGDFQQGQVLSRFLDLLDNENQLPKTILYNLNPADNALFATMASNFNDGTVAGKVQFGSAWWFNDQKDGMELQINALSNMGLLSRFVGMLTDSRSFLSYPRHDYFRRILCNLIGQDVENGELPAETAWLGEMVEGICYHNAKEYFGF